MRITTLNHKHEDYLENHEIYVGTQTGSFKRLCVFGEKPHSQINLQDLKTLTKDCRITTIEFGDDDRDEILIGRKNRFVQTYSTASNSFVSVKEFTEGPIVGLGRYDEKIVAGIGTGKIQLYKEPESIILSTGDNISRMRQCPTNNNLFASGGKERQNNLKIFDMKESKEIFRSKNLPNDFLQLEVPIWDSDLGFIDGNVVATCSRYGYVRVYDIRTQRRPIMKYSAPEEQMSFCSLIAKENFVYCGSTMGVAKAFDIRKFKTFAHTYKGFTGSISDLCLDETGKYLISSCLDRYVRVHHADSCVMLYQCYVKSKATRVIVKTLANVKVESSDDELVIANIENNSEENDDNCSDDEYEAMFAKMPKIKEIAEEGSIKSTKRKVAGSHQKTKKKKL